MYAIKAFENGFEYIEVQNSAASAKIALQGAHIFEYEQKGEDPLLWLSKESLFEKGTAIRGGIPLCWPRFGNRDKALPQHGFARTALFELVNVLEENEELTKIHLQLKSSAQTKTIWNYEFVLDIVFTITDTLAISMITHNRDTKSFLITQAFHTYFLVSDIEDVTIFGLEGITFSDTLINEQHTEYTPLQIKSEIDRVYEGEIGTIVLRDAKKEVEIESQNSASVIVWNPWIEKSSKMSAMDTEGYKEFVCIESANAFDDLRSVAPNESCEIKVLYKEG